MLPTHYFVAILTVTRQPIRFRSIFTETFKRFLLLTLIAFLRANKYRSRLPNIKLFGSLSISQRTKIGAGEGNRTLV